MAALFGWNDRLLEASYETVKLATELTDADIKQANERQAAKLNLIGRLEMNREPSREDHENAQAASPDAVADRTRGDSQADVTAVTQGHRRADGAAHRAALHRAQCRRRQHLCSLPFG
ncbi:hypothetical protein AAVH_08590 [Aphelenchoides avenae]|nr:hypothetical protein AAVH_08590 [Aphelenchus avenae]